MIDRLRVLLAFQAITYVIAGMIHSGAVLDGHKLQAGFIAESLIAAALITGLLVSLFRPAVTRDAALAAQGFALVLTCIGLFLLVVGANPRSVPEFAYHIGIIAILIWGLREAWQMPREHLPQAA
jgi:hypothetical protein